MKYVYEIEIYYAGWNKIHIMEGNVFSSKKKAQAFITKYGNPSRNYRIVKKEVE